MKTRITLFLLGAASTIWAASSWPQFRGPNCSGVATNDAPPVEFSSGKGLAWKIEVPTGLSSPCISNGRLFLTGVDGQKLLALCYDARTGKEHWRHEIPAGKLQDVHKVSSQAVATPASDDDRVYFYFVSFGLIAYDMAGKEQWRKPLRMPFVMNGSGTSPILTGDTLILNCDQDEGESFLLAVEARSGKTRWQTSRAGFTGSYSTPMTWTHDDQTDVVVAGSVRAVGYDLGSGKQRWTAAVLTSVAVAATPVAGDGHIYLMSRGTPPNAMGTFADFVKKNDKDGDGKISKTEAPSFFLDGGVFRVLDRNKDGFITDSEWAEMMDLFSKGDSGLFALRPGTGDVTSSHVAWKQAKGAAGISSPLFYDGRIYVVQDGGRLTCRDAKSGQAVYEQERIGADGEYYASPIAANGNIYVASSRGTISTIKAGETFEVRARNALDEPIMATPAIANDTLYVRTAKHLWAFGKSR